jgi:hypothetical protein
MVAVAVHVVFFWVLSLTMQAKVVNTIPEEQHESQRQAPEQILR